MIYASLLLFLSLLLYLKGRIEKIVADYVLIKKKKKIMYPKNTAPQNLVNNVTQDAPEVAEIIQ